MSISLTAAVKSAAQFLDVIDSGEDLSAQQVIDALPVANRLLASWTNEQTLSIQLLVSEQARAGAKAIAAQVGAGNVFIAEQEQAGVPLALAYTLAGGQYVNPIYTPPAYIAPSFVPGPVPQFADLVTPITLPGVYERAFVLSLAIEIAPQYNTEPSAALVKQAAEARAAASPVPNRPPVPGTSGQATVPLSEQPGQ